MINIPNYKNINAKTVVFDLNGTLAIDGKINDDIKELLIKLSKIYNIVVITADTYGTLRNEFKEYNYTIEIIKNTKEKSEKAQKYSPYIAIGNGNNDIEMFENSELSIAIIGEEGCSGKLLLHSDIVVHNIVDAMNLLLNEKRMIATLRK